MEFRVNYGNGQVWDCKSAAEGWRHIDECNEGRGWVERYEAGTADDPGDWFHLRRRDS